MHLISPKLSVKRLAKVKKRNFSNKILFTDERMVTFSNRSFKNSKIFFFDIKGKKLKEVTLDNETYGMFRDAYLNSQNEIVVFMKKYLLKFNMVGELLNKNIFSDFYISSSHNIKKISNDHVIVNGFSNPSSSDDSHFQVFSLSSLKIIGFFNKKDGQKIFKFKSSQVVDGKLMVISGSAGEYSFSKVSYR